MNCDRCENEASVHLTQVLNGQMQKMHLCASCAKELGVNEDSSFSMSDLLLGQGSAAPLSGHKSSTHCPECGLTLARLRKVGRLGCPACYESFAKELKVILRSMHHAEQHVGRHPQHRERNLSRRGKEEALELELADAVASEDYEKAAQLRDQLHSLQSTEPSS